VRAGEIIVAVEGKLRREHRRRRTVYRREWSIGVGASRIDVAAINGRITGCEIKSARDNFGRLASQVRVYSAVLDTAVLAVEGEAAATRAAGLVPDWWGIWCATETSRGAALDVVRMPQDNPAPEPLADHVVVASGAYHHPKVPAFAAELDPGIVQLHSHEYKGPSQLLEGAVLLVGFGNSGAEIGVEVARTHPTWLSGKETGQIPFRHGPNTARFVFPLVRFAGHHVLTVRTPIGRKARPQLVSHGAPLIRVKLKDITAAGIERVPRTVGVRDGLPELEDGRVLDVANVIWCTGFRSDFGWIDLPICDEDGEPVHDRGVVASQPGLYFMGLEFQYAFSSAMISGVGRDAEYVARHIASRTSKARAATPVPAGALSPEI
jgi:hypothetical protein